MVTDRLSSIGDDDKFIIEISASRVMGLPFMSSSPFSRQLAPKMDCLTTALLCSGDHDSCIAATQGCFFMRESVHLQWTRPAVVRSVSGIPDDNDYIDARQPVSLA
jgi:hypothetical protein